MELILFSDSALDRVAATKREMRLSMRAAVEAFHAYALASLSESLTTRGIDYDQLTSREQELEYERTGLPLKLFYGWLREDMMNICVTGIDPTMQ